jgi:hypothetical protein
VIDEVVKPAFNGLVVDGEGIYQTLGMGTDELGGKMSLLADSLGLPRDAAEALARRQLFLSVSDN